MIILNIVLRPTCAIAVNHIFKYGRRTDDEDLKIRKKYLFAMTRKCQQFVTVLLSFDTHPEKTSGTHCVEKLPWDWPKLLKHM